MPDPHTAEHEQVHRPATGDSECTCGGWVGPMTTLPAADPRSFAAHLSAELERLREALENVRKVATLHFLGAAFDPEHMRSIANYCAGVLNGESIPDDLDDAPEAYFLQVLRENGWEVRRAHESPAQEHPDA